MTENEQIKHNLLLNIKRLEGILERIDKFCHNYNKKLGAINGTVIY